MIKICPHCEQEFNNPPSRGYTFCTTACRREAALRKRACTCEFCGELFLRESGQTRRFCSTWCTGQSALRKSRGVPVFPEPVEGAFWVSVGPQMFALVDLADAPLVEGRTWTIKHGYPATWIRGRLVTMHRILMDGPEIDHLDRDRLNNRRSNLRVATRLENVLNRGLQKNNTSGHKGVTRCGSKWKSQAGSGKSGTFKYLGVYATVEEAAAAYDAHMRATYGDALAIGIRRAR